MSTANISIPRWKEYSIAVWIIPTVITGLILWFGWPAIGAVIAIIQLSSIGSSLQQDHIVATGSRETCNYRMNPWIRFVFLTLLLLLMSPW